MPRSVTLDTSLLQEYWKNQDKRATVEQLIERAGRGELALAVTARIREDIPNQPLASMIEILDQIGVEEIASVTRPDYWVLGRDILGDDRFVTISESLDKARQAAGQKNCPDWRDWDHLHAHYLSGRDVFLTWDKGIRSVGPELHRSFRNSRCAGRSASWCSTSR
jgi:hypothetical protein